MDAQNPKLVIHPCKWWEITYHESGILRANRTERGFEDNKEFIESLEYLLALLDQLDRSKNCLFLDVRKAPLRSDPEAESIITKYNALLFKDLVAAAVLVKTKTGNLQASKLSQKTDTKEKTYRAAEVFDSENDAYSYLQNALNSKDSDPADIPDEYNIFCDSILNSLRDPIIVLDKDGDTVRWQNRESKIRFGEFSNRSLASSLILSEDESWSSLVQQAFNLSITIKINQKNGLNRKYEMRSVYNKYKDEKLIVLSFKESFQYHPEVLELEFIAQKFKTVFDQLDRHFCVLATDGTVLEANRKAVAFAGCPITGQLIWKTPLWNRARAGQREIQSVVEQTLLTGITYKGIVPNKSQSNLDIVLNVLVTPVKGDNNETQFILVMSEDITQNYNLQQKLKVATKKAETASRAKSEFLAVMSHEIRTPLNGVIGMLNLLDKTDLSPEQSKKLNLAKFSGDALLTVINDILDFSKIEAGKMDIELISFNFVDTINQTFQSFVPQAFDKGLNLHLDISPNLPQLFIGDPRRVQQVLFNLIGNSLKFTAKGGIIVTLSGEPISPNLYRMVTTVTDSGIGIPKNKIPSLFEKFTQMDSSTTREFGGTGLGLAICKQLCKLMNGDIQASSEKGQGSKFSFYLDLKLASK